MFSWAASTIKIQKGKTLLKTSLKYLPNALKRTRRENANEHVCESEHEDLTNKPNAIDNVIEHSSGNANENATNESEHVTEHGHLSDTKKQHVNEHTNANVDDTVNENEA